MVVKNNKKIIVLMLLAVIFLELIGVAKVLQKDEYKGLVHVGNIKNKTSVLSASIVDAVSNNEQTSKGYDTITYNLIYNLDTSSDATQRYVIIKASLNENESRYAHFKKITENNIESVLTENGRQIELRVLSNVDTENRIALKLYVENAPNGFSIHPNITIREETDINEETYAINTVTVNTRSVEGYVKENNEPVAKVELALIKDGKEIKRTYTDSEGKYVFSDLADSAYTVEVKEEIYELLSDGNISAVDTEKNLEIKRVDPYTLETHKYINKAKLIINGKEETYTYDDLEKIVQTVKNAREIEGSITFKIVIKNIGDKDGNIGLIKDFVQDGLKFDKDKNPGWIEKNNALYYKPLEGVTLKSKESRSMTLTLDIIKTNEAKVYINKVTTEGDIYEKIVYILDNSVFREDEVLYGEKLDKPNISIEDFSGWYTDKNYTNKYDFENIVTKDLILYGKTNNPHVSHTIKFYDEDPTDSTKKTLWEEQTVFEGETITPPSQEPSKEGYTFECWSLNGICFDFDEVVTEDMTLKSKYSKNEYTVTFMDGEVEHSKQTVAYNELMEIPSNPIKEHYTFKYWSLNENGEEYDLTTPVTKDIVLHSVYEMNKYNVKFIDNGEVIREGLINYGSIIEPVAPNGKEGYTFKYWSETPNGTAFNFENRIVNDTTLYSVYEINKYTVTFMNEGSQYGEIQTINYNSRATKPANPTKEGYTFKYWHKDGENEFDFETLITEDITLYSEYEINKFTVKFIDEGEVIKEGLINYGSIIEPATVSDKEGKTFKHWSETPNGTPYDFSQTINRDLNLYSVYETNQYTVTFIDDGNTIKTIALNYNDIVPTEEIPTVNKPGNTFKHWSEEPNGEAFDFNNNITRSITVYSVYDLNRYTITFMNEDSQYGEIQTVNYNGKATKPTDPTKEGYTFKYWHEDGEGEFDFNTSITENITLYSEYEINKYNVKFIDEGVVIREGLINYGSIIEQVAPNGKEGYTFKHWSETPNGPAYNFNITVKDDVTLFSVYEINRYTVTFMNEGSQYGEVQTVSYNATAVRPTNPTKEGYTFKYWHKDGANEFDFNTPITENITLYSEYEINKYNVKFIDEGVVIREGLINHGSIIEPAAPNGKEGYTFKHWSEEINGSSYNFDNPVNKDLTLYSVYEINKYNVEFYDEGTLVKTITVNYNSTISNSDAPTVSKEGYTFTFWSLEGATNEFNFSVPIKNNTKLNSNYVINHNGVIFNDENRITEVEVNWGETVNPVSSQGKTGYTFSHWSKTVNGEAFDFNTPISEPTILYAVYTINTYNIGYEYNGGTLPEGVTNPSTYTIDDSDITLNNPKKTGYTFIGWNDGEETKNPYIISSGSTGNKTLTAVYDVISYNIDYQYNGGSLPVGVINLNVYTIESPDITINNPTKAGYTFIGWNDGTETKNPYIVPTGSTGNVYLSAEFEAIPYSITYNLEGGALPDGVVNPSTYTTNNSDITINNPKKAGYTFIGWNDGTNTKNPYIIPTGSTGNKTLTAVYEMINYTIAYDYRGGNLPTGITNPSVYTINDLDITINNPSKEGYTFIGWNDGTETKNPYIITSSNIGNKTLKAEYEAISYSITYNLEGGMLPEGITNPEEYTISSPDITINNPIKEGYTFIGWNDGTSTKNPYVIPTGSKGNKTLTAIYEQIDYTYDITYNYNGGTLPEGVTNPSTYSKESLDILINNPSKAGYTFIGWNDGTSTKNPYVIPTGSTGNISLTAEYEAIEYSITYNYNGGTLDSDVTNPSVYTINDLDVTINNPSKVGYTFIGWNDGEETKNPYVITSSNVGNKTLTAVYEITEYTIEYNYVGGSLAEGVTNPSTYTVESPDITINIPYKDGYTFERWNDGEETKNPYIIPTGSTGNITLTAEYSAIPYYIEYNLNGGSLAEGVTNPMMYSKDSPDITINNPSKEGYIFVGWNDGTETKNPYVILTGSTGNKVLNAEYEETQYTITFINEGSQYGEVQTVDYNDLATPPEENPIKEGYTFKYWSEEENGSAFDFNTRITENKVLYSVYNVNTYIVTFMNGNSIFATQSVEYNQKATMPEDLPTDETLSFAYWALNGEEYNFDTPVVEDITLTSVFESVLAPKIVHTPTAWTNDKVTVTVLKNDLLPDETGYTYKYKIEDGEYQNYEGSFEVTENSDVYAIAIKDDTTSTETKHEIRNIDKIVPIIDSLDYFSSSSTSVDISITGHDQESGLQEFRIYKDDEYITTLSLTGDLNEEKYASYTLNGLITNEYYTVKIYAYDAAGNMSSASEIEVMAEKEYVCRIIGRNNSIYSDASMYERFQSLSEAIESCDNNQCTIQMLKNVEESNDISEGQEVTIDLNGKTITGTNSYTFKNSGEFTLINNPIVESLVGKVINNTDTAIINESTGRLTLGVDDVELNVSQTAPYIEGTGTGIKNSGTFNFFDGIIKAITAIEGKVLYTPEGYNANVINVTEGGVSLQEATLKVLSDAEARIGYVYYTKVQNSVQDAKGDNYTSVTDEEEFLPSMKNVATYGFHQDDALGGLVSENNIENTTAGTYTIIDLTDESEPKELLVLSEIISNNNSEYSTIAAKESVELIIKDNATGDIIYQSTNSNFNQKYTKVLSPGKKYYISISFNTVYENDNDYLTDSKCVIKEITLNDYVIQSISNAYGEDEGPDQPIYGFDYNEATGALESNNSFKEYSTAYGYYEIDLTNETESKELIVRTSLDTINYSDKGVVDVVEGNLELYRDSSNYLSSLSVYNSGPSYYKYIGPVNTTKILSPGKKYYIVFYYFKGYLNYPKEDYDSVNSRDKFIINSIDLVSLSDEPSVDLTNQFTYSGTNGFEYDDYYNYYKYTNMSQGKTVDSYVKIDLRNSEKDAVLNINSYLGYATDKDSRYMYLSTTPGNASISDIINNRNKLILYYKPYISNEYIDGSTHYWNYHDYGVVLPKGTVYYFHVGLYGDGTSSYDYLTFKNIRLNYISKEDYKYGKNVNLFTTSYTPPSSEDGEIVDGKVIDSFDNALRFVGSNTNNYVTFNNELWRIIGVFDTEDENGVKKPRIKIMRNDILIDTNWDVSTTDINNGNGINEWSQAELMKLLNPGYDNNQNYVYRNETYELETIDNSLYWNKSSGYCYSGGPSYKTCDFTNTGLSEDAKRYIDTVKWYTASINTPYTNLTPLAMYDIERGTTTGKDGVSGSNYDTVPRTTSWFGKVGLPYNSDYSFASGHYYSGNDISITRNDCMNSSFNSSAGACISTNNWMWWTQMPMFSITPTNGLISPSGSPSPFLVTGLNGTYPYTTSANSPFNVKPAVYLSTKTVVSGGEGTINNPYTLTLGETENEKIDSYYGFVNKEKEEQVVEESEDLEVFSTSRPKNFQIYDFDYDEETATYINQNIDKPFSIASKVVPIDLTDAEEGLVMQVESEISTTGTTSAYIAITEYLNNVDYESYSGPSSINGIYTSYVHSVDPKIETKVEEIKLEKGHKYYLELCYFKKNAVSPNENYKDYLKVTLGTKNYVYSTNKYQNYKGNQIVPESESDTIVLVKNVTKDSKIIIPEDKDVTIDLNGYYLTNSISDYVIENNGSLKVIDSKYLDAIDMAEINYERDIRENQEKYERETAQYQEEYDAEMAEFNVAKEQYLSAGYDYNDYVQGAFINLNSYNHGSDDTKWLDLSMGREVTLTNATWDTDGGLILNDYTSAINFEPIKSVTDFTHEMVFETNEIGTKQYLFLHHATSGKDRLQVYINSAGKIKVELKYYSSSWNTRVNMTSNTTLEANKKYSIAVTYSSSNTIKLFINGELDVESPSTSYSHTYSGSLKSCIGTENFTDITEHSILKGKIYAFRSYITSSDHNLYTATTEDEILENYKIDKALYNIDTYTPDIPEFETRELDYSGFKKLNCDIYSSSYICNTRNYDTDFSASYSYYSSPNIIYKKQLYFDTNYSSLSVDISSGVLNSGSLTIGLVKSGETSYNVYKSITGSGTYELTPTETGKYKLVINGNRTSFSTSSRTVSFSNFKLNVNTPVLKEATLDEATYVPAEHKGAITSSTYHTVKNNEGALLNVESGLISESKSGSSSNPYIAVDNYGKVTVGKDGYIRGNGGNNVLYTIGIYNRESGDILHGEGTIYGKGYSIITESKVDSLIDGYVINSPINNRNQTDLTLENVNMNITSTHNSPIEHASNSKLTIVNSNLTGSNASNNYGIYLSGTSSNGEINVIDSKIEKMAYSVYSNTTSGSLYRTINITNSELENDIYIKNSRGVYLYIYNSNIGTITFDSYNYTGRLSVDNSNVSRINTYSGYINVNKSKIGISYFYYGNVTINDSEYTSTLHNYTSTSIINSKLYHVDNNYSTSNSSCSVSACKTSTGYLTIRDSEVIGSTQNTKGRTTIDNSTTGGLFNYNSATMYIQNNSTVGGVYCGGKSTVYMSDVTSGAIENNSSYLNIGKNTIVKEWIVHKNNGYNTPQTTLGTNDNIVDNDTIIIKKGVSAYNTSPVFKYYDGTIISMENSEAISSMAINAVPTGCDIHSSIVDGIETITLLKLDDYNVNDYEAAIGDREYKKLIDAINAAHNNEETTIRLLKDKKSVYNHVVDHNKIINLDFNGHSINNFSSSNILLENEGVLKLQDLSGSSKNSNTRGGLLIQNDNIMDYNDIIISCRIINNGTFTMNSGTINGSLYTEGQIKNTDTMIINGGTLKGNSWSTSSTYYGIYNSGTLTINGGSFSSYQTVINSIGNVFINGGEFTNNYNLLDASSNVTIDEVNIAKGIYRIGDIKSNGTFNINNSKIILYDSNTPASTINGNLNINGSEVGAEPSLRNGGYVYYWPYLFKGSSTSTNFNIKDSILRGNTVFTGTGSIDIYNSEIRGNTGVINLTNGDHINIVSGSVVADRWASNCSVVDAIKAGNIPITIGTKGDLDKNGNVILSRSNPEIAGTSYGINTSGSIYFYDGMVRGSSAIYGSIAEVETGYEVIRILDTLGEAKYLDVEPVVKNLRSEIEYNNIQDAIDEAQANDTLYMLRNLTQLTTDPTYEVDSNKTITLDLGGHQLIQNNSKLFNNSGDLTLADSGTGNIYNSGSGLIVDNSGKLTLSRINVIDTTSYDTINNTGELIVSSARIQDTAGGSMIVNSGETTITDSTLVDSLIGVTSTKNYIENSGKVDISDTNITGYRIIRNLSSTSESTIENVVVETPSGNYNGGTTGRYSFDNAGTMTINELSFNGYKTCFIPIEYVFNNTNNMDITTLKIGFYSNYERNIFNNSGTLTVDDVKNYYTSAYVGDVINNTGTATLTRIGDRNDSFNTISYLAKNTGQLDINTLYLKSSGKELVSNSGTLNITDGTISQSFSLSNNEYSSTVIKSLMDNTGTLNLNNVKTDTRVSFSYNYLFGLYKTIYNHGGDVTITGGNYYSNANQFMKNNSNVTITDATISMYKGIDTTHKIYLTNTDISATAQAIVSNTDIDITGGEFTSAGNEYIRADSSSSRLEYVPTIDLTNSVANIVGSTIRHTGSMHTMALTSSTLNMPSGSIYASTKGSYVGLSVTSTSICTVNLGTKGDLNDQNQLNVSNADPYIEGVSIYTDTDYKSNNSFKPSYLNFYDGKIKYKPYYYNHLHLQDLNDLETGYNVRIDGDYLYPTNENIIKNIDQNVEYTSFETAINDSNNGDTLQFLNSFAIYPGDGDNTINDYIVSIPSGKNITIDLNGKDINFARPILQNNGTLNITDSVGDSVITGNNIKNNSTGVLNISGGEFILENTGITNISGGKITVTNDTNGEINISGGESIIDNTNGGPITQSSGKLFLKVNNNDVNITGGTVKIGINSTNGEIIIDNATIENNDLTSYGGNNNGAIVITNSTFEGNIGINRGALNISTSTGPIGVTNSNGVFNLRDSVITSTASLNATGGIINISGCTYNNVSHLVTLTKADVTVSNSQGTFTDEIAVMTTSPLGKLTILDGEFSTSAEKGINITNGTLTLGSKDTTVTTSVPKITASKYGVYKATGTFNFYDGRVGGSDAGVFGTVDDTEVGYKIINSTISDVVYSMPAIDSEVTRVAMVNGVNYGTLQEAINACVDNVSTDVILYANITFTDDITVPADKIAVIYLNGFTITKGSYDFIGDGSVTISDGAPADLGGSLHNVIANVYGEDVANVNIVITEMSDGSKLKSDVTYRLYKDGKLVSLNENKIGDYYIGSEVEELRTVKNRIYINELKSGNYELKDSNGKNIMFSIEPDGTINGNVKEYNRTNSINVINNALAEYIIVISTGVNRIPYFIILLVIISLIILSFVIIKTRKKHQKVQNI